MLYKDRSDGYARVFNSRNGVEKFLLQPKKNKFGVDVETFFADVLDQNRILLGNKERFMSIVDFEGKIVKTFGLEDSSVNFVSAAVSNKKKYVYGMCSNKYLYCFNLDTYKLDQFAKISEGEILGVAHNPKKNSLVVFTDAFELIFINV